MAVEDFFTLVEKSPKARQLQARRVARPKHTDHRERKGSAVTHTHTHTKHHTQQQHAPRKPTRPHESTAKAKARTTKVFKVVDGKCKVSKFARG